MNGYETAPELRCTRVPCDDPEIAVFGVSGSLGPGAKPLLERLFDRCMQYRLRRVVLDLSGLESLGGGGARMLREFAAQREQRGWETAYVVTSPTMHRFLSAASHDEPPLLAESVEAALAVLDAAPVERPPPAPAAGDPGGVRLQRHSGGMQWDDVLSAVGLDAGHGEASQGLSASRQPTQRDAPPTGYPAPDDSDDFAALASGWSRHLRERGLASRLHVFALQPDGVYHPLSTTGIDLEKGLPYHGLLASRVRAQQGPGFLFDLCIDPLSEEEHDVLASMDCEVVARTGGGEDPELLLFLGKANPGDEYTLEELQDLQEVLDAGLPRTVATVPSGARRTQDQSPEMAVDSAHDPWSERSDAMHEAPVPRAPVEPLLGSNDARRRLRSPTNLLGEPAYRESERERLLRRKLTQLRDIVGLSRDFDASFGTARILEVLVLAVVSVARTETVLLLSERDGEYHLTHHRGLDRTALAEMALRVDSTLVQAALRCEAPLRIEHAEDISAEEKIWARQHRFPYVAPFRSRDRVLGVLFLGETQSGDLDLEMLTYLLQEAALAFERALLFETLQNHTLGVVRGLVTLIESCSGQDVSTTERVARYTQALAQELQFPEALRRDLAYGAVLRDVGMLRIDPAILRTSGQLTPQQWDIVRRHPVDGASIMRQMRFSEAAVEIVLHHHEAYNGEGYPAGLRGRAIPLGARIVSVAESYVKMTLDRPYRKALGRVEALESLAENWGLRYDPQVVDALVLVVNRELSIGLEGETELARDLFGV